MTSSTRARARGSFVNRHTNARHAGQSNMVFQSVQKERNDGLVQEVWKIRENM